MTAGGVDARLAVRASPLLAEFNRAGLLASADVHVATRLGRLGGEGNEDVLLAAALAVRAVRAGSVCLRLDDLGALALPETEPGEPTGPDAVLTGTAADTTDAVDVHWPDEAAWTAGVVASPLVATGPDDPAVRPLRWVDGRLYLDRYWRDEQLVRAQIDARVAIAAADLDLARLATAVDRLFPAPLDGPQRVAAAACVLGRLTVLTGGPGTGKTTAVARILAVLRAVLGPNLRVALAAPTGKAAARLQEAVMSEVVALEPEDRRRVGAVEATTVHRLLGWRPGSSTRFRHSRAHRLPQDVVIVDETSMVSLPLMARLLEATRPQARLLLVGDPDQLASVEAGAVLGDLVARPAPPSAIKDVASGERPPDVVSVVARVLPDDCTPAVSVTLRSAVVRLVTAHRYGGAIADLAGAIRAGDVDATLSVLRGEDPAVTFIETAPTGPTATEAGPIRRDAENAGLELVNAAWAGEAAAALRALERHRLLLAHRQGPAGAAWWAALVEAWVHEAVRRSATRRPDVRGPWYPGRPLLVTRNDRDAGLFNGDTGVVILEPGAHAEQFNGEHADPLKPPPVVGVFGDPTSPVIVRPHRLSSVETVYAMTVHRGQGSQFRRVSLVLPPPSSPLLTRELLYTAATRAREAVRVVGSVQAIEVAVSRPVRRASGLRYPLSRVGLAPEGRRSGADGDPSVPE